MPSNQIAAMQLHVSPLVEVRRAAEFETGKIAGYASTWGGPPDSYGTMFAKGAFSESLIEHSREKTSPIMLWAHDTAEPIGKWTALREDETGLYVEGKLNLSTSNGREAFAHLKAGDLNGLSVGVYLDRTKIKRNADGTATIGKADVFEISVVTVPSNKRARVSQVRSLQSKAELVELLRSGGLPKIAAQRVAAAGWPVLSVHDESRARSLIERINSQTQIIRNMK